MMNLMTVANVVSEYSDLSNSFKITDAPPMNYCALYNFWYQNHITISLVLLIVAICISIWKMYTAVQQLNRRSSMYKKRYKQNERTLLELKEELVYLNKEATKWHYWYEEMREELDRIKASLMKLKAIVIKEDE